MKLNNSRTVKAMMDSFLGKILESSLTFYEGMKEFFSNDMENFDSRVGQIKRLENEVDEARREIEYSIYGNMLIPESRSDVLKLLERLDDIANTAKKIIINFDIERPVIPENIEPYFIKIVEMSKNGVEALIEAISVFFGNKDVLKPYIEKVVFYEHEVDRLEEQAKREIFKTDLSLSAKNQLKYHVEMLTRFSDSSSEDMAELLVIASIKREM